MEDLLKKKNQIIILTFLMSAITQAGLVLYTPAFLQISRQLHISSKAVELTLTVYFFGFGISQLLYGILSDRFGRKKMALAGMTIFLIGCLWSVAAHSYFDLLFSRVLQGIGAGSGMTLSRAIVRDSFTGLDYVRAATYLSSGFALGLGVTPVIGGHLLDFFSWRSEFIFLFVCGLLLLIAIWIFLPETHKLELSKSSPKQFICQVKQNIFSILKRKSFYNYLIAGVAAYGVIISYNTMAPMLFQKALGISSSLYGWLTLLVAITYYIATSFNRWILKYCPIKSIIIAGVLLIFISGICMLLIKLIFGVFNLYAVFIPLILATFGQALIWSISITGALKDLSHIAGTAAAFFSFLQMLLSTLISGIIIIPTQNSQIPLAIVIISLAIISWISFQLGAFKSKCNLSP